MIIIGVSGKIQSGKSTFVDHLRTKLPGSEIIRFADSLKQIILDCFIPPKMNLNAPEDLDLDEVKNMELPCGKTIRELLQIIGTDWFRHTWEDCWINAYKKKVKRMYSCVSTVILTPDVRFPNEIKSIQQMGGIVVRLLRNPFGSLDQHESETALDYLDELYHKGRVEISLGHTPGEMFDLVYDNREKTLEDTQEWINDKFMKCFVEKTDRDQFCSEMTKTYISNLDLRRLVE
jgi:hypothetical protein